MLVARSCASHTLPDPGAAHGLYGLSRGWLFLSSTAAPLEDPLLPLGQARCWCTKGCCSSSVAIVVKPSRGASCPFLSSLSCQQPSNCMVNAVLLQALFPADRAGGCCPACPGSQEDDGVGSPGLGLLCHFSVYFPDPSSHSLWWQMWGLSPPVWRLRVAGGSILHSPCSSPAAELSKKLFKNTSNN